MGVRLGGPPSWPQVGGLALGGCSFRAGGAWRQSSQAAQGRFCPAAPPSADSQAGSQALPCPSGRPQQALQASCSCPGHLSPFILPGSPQETPSHPLSPPRRHSGSFTPLPGHPPVQWTPWSGPLHLRGVLVGRGRAGPPLLEACTRLGGRRGRRDVTSSPPPLAPPGLGHLLGWC